MTGIQHREVPTTVRATMKAELQEELRYLRFRGRDEECAWPELVGLLRNPFHQFVGEAGAVAEENIGPLPIDTHHVPLKEPNVSVLLAPRTAEFDIPSPNHMHLQQSTATV